MWNINSITATNFNLHIRESLPFIDFMPPKKKRSGNRFCCYSNSCNFCLNVYFIRPRIEHRNVREPKHLLHVPATNYRTSDISIGRK